MHANDNRQYLTPEQLTARWLGRITTRTLANWRFLGVGPRYSKIGGRVLYPLEAVEEWESRRTVESTSGYRRALVGAWRPVVFVDEVPPLFRGEVDGGWRRLIPAVPPARHRPAVRAAVGDHRRQLCNGR